MAKFMEDTKNKIQDLFVYLVSCGKSFKATGKGRKLHSMILDVSDFELLISACLWANFQDQKSKLIKFEVLPIGSFQSIGNWKKYLEIKERKMAKFMEDMKNKIQDLLVYLVSCGKSSEEPSGNDQEPARNVPIGDDLGLKIYIPEEDQAGPARNALSQGHIVVIGPGNNTQNQEQPIIPPGDIAQQGQGLDESAGNSQSQKQVEENEDDFEPLPDGFIPQGRANFSRPPAKRSAPVPKTG